MHKDYWEKEKCMMELEETSRFEEVNLELIKAEENLKKSMDCDASREEIDYFNGKLSKEELQRLEVRLKVLLRNMELKGNDLKEVMCEPTLLDVLKKKVQKLLMRLKAHGRARRPKEKKRGANPTKSTWMLPHHKKAELVKEDHVEKKLNCVLNGSGRNMLIKDHNKKFFKENFKTP